MQYTHTHILHGLCLVVSNCANVFPLWFVLCLRMNNACLSSEMSQYWHTNTLLLFQKCDGDDIFFPGTHTTGMTLWCTERALNIKKKNILPPNRHYRKENLQIHITMALHVEDSKMKINNYLCTYFSNW